MIFVDMKPTNAAEDHNIAPESAHGKRVSIKLVRIDILSDIGASNKCEMICLYIDVIEAFFNVN